MDDLAPEDHLARVAAESARAARLKQRHEKRTNGLLGASGERARFEKERERFLTSELLEGARIEERRRISRELHDCVSHLMAVVHQSLQLYEALKEHDPELAEAKLALAKQTAVEAMDQTRDLSLMLRETEATGGFEPLLSELLEESIPSEVEQELRVEGDESLILTRVRDQLFLILREGVRNAVAHSGAGRISVELNIITERVVASVEDDGRGFDRNHAGATDSGCLIFVEERAQLVGGTCQIRLSPKDGTRVEVIVPLPAKRGNA